MQNPRGLGACTHQKAVDYLLGTLYQNPKAVADLPEWNYTDYDSIWTISIDATGNLQFSNSCEGLHSELLPSTCPAFSLHLQVNKCKFLNHNILKILAQKLFACLAGMEDAVWHLRCSTIYSECSVQLSRTHPNVYWL